MTPDFDHRDSGTDESHWDPWLAEQSPAVRLADVLPFGCTDVVVVAAHPDDEALGAGGLVAQCHDAGLTVRFVVATAGEASHASSPSHDPARLADRRRAELATATSILAPAATVDVLGLPDGRLAQHEEELVAAVVAQVGLHGRHTLLLAPWRHDGHSDHEVAGRAAATAAHRTDAVLWEYPIWLWHWGTREDLAPPTTWHTVGLGSEARARKVRAIASHASQLADLSPAPGDEAIVSADMLRHFHRDYEVYVHGAPAVDDALDALHAAHSDPWQVERSWYERRKSAISLASLPGEGYRRAVEVGCSIGVLTGQLSTRCEQVVAVDASPTAVAAARRRLDHLPAVEVHQLRVPDQWPSGTFDLVVVSELGYFLSPAQLDALTARIQASLDPGGTVVLCHWRPQPIGWPLNGDVVHQRLVAGLGLPVVVTHEESQFLLQVLSQRGTASPGPP